MALSRSRSFSKILIFSVKLNEAKASLIFDLSICTFQKPALELIPLCGQTLALNDGLQCFHMDCALFDKLQNAEVVFCSSGLQRNRHKVLFCHNPSAHPLNLRW